jgi:undecaprenyl-phosphate galactose phosphotransferase
MQDDIRLLPFLSGELQKSVPFSSSSLRYFFAQRVIKRGMDIGLSLLLLVATAPLLVVIACWVKLDSRGPVFYLQHRIGSQGKSFRIIKFRTMHTDAWQRFRAIIPDDADLEVQWQACFKRADDSRITRLGRILRRHSLDELPQLVNVLFGQMSLVGPRPVVLRELTERYKKTSRIYTKVRPGMTGLWQVSGRSTTSYRRRIALDRSYVKTWTLWLDLFILFKTVKVVWTCEGAV